MKNLIIILIACLSLVSCTKEDLGLLRNTKNHNTNNGINGGINTTDYTKTSCLDSFTFVFEINIQNQIRNNNNLFYGIGFSINENYYDTINYKNINISTPQYKNNLYSSFINTKKIVIYKNDSLCFDLNFNEGTNNKGIYKVKNYINSTIFGNINITIKFNNKQYSLIKNINGHFTLTLKASDLIYRNNNQK